MQNFARVFVLITGLVCSGYGVAVLFFPDIISILTGMGLDHWTARLEVQAWYLVTEVALGILSFYAWKEPQRYLRLALLIWMATFWQLVLFRFIGTWYYDSYFDLKLDPAYLPDSYHIVAAYLYELPTALVFLYLWLQREKIAP